MPKILESCYYFGCIGESGHYLFDQNERHVYESGLSKGFPVKISILDGGLFPQKLGHYTRDGEAFLAHINGWTIVSFNDSTVDRRPGSHSVFVVHGVKTFDDAITAARSVFPQVFKRFTFPVLLSGDAGEQVTLKSCPACGYQDTPTEREFLKACKRAFGDLPVRAMMKRKWICVSENGSIEEVRQELIRFFGVADANELDKVLSDPEYALRNFRGLACNIEPAHPGSK